MEPRPDESVQVQGVGGRGMSTRDGWRGGELGGAGGNTLRIGVWLDRFGDGAAGLCSLVSDPPIT